MNFIAKIFLGKTDEHVHSQFVRYSIGEYAQKAVAHIKNGPKAKIATGFEYVNDFLALAGEHAKGELTVDGKIFLKKEMETPFSLTKKKGYFVGDVQQKVTPKQLKEWVEQYGEHGYFLLNVASENIILKTKTAPHNPKGKYDEKFCKVIVSGPLKELFLKDIVFEEKEFKVASVAHAFTITDIIIPKEYEHDMALARLHAKREGKIIRTVVFDGKEIKTEKDFVA